MPMLTYPEGLRIGVSLHLHPYFVYACNKGSGESAHLNALDFAAPQYFD